MVLVVVDLLGADLILVLAQVGRSLAAGSVAGDYYCLRALGGRWVLLVRVAVTLATLFLRVQVLY